MSFTNHFSRREIRERFAEGSRKVGERRVCQDPPLAQHGLVCLAMLPLQKRFKVFSTCVSVVGQSAKDLGECVHFPVFNIQSSCKSVLRNNMIIWKFPCPNSAGGAKSSRKGGVQFWRNIILNNPHMTSNSSNLAFLCLSFQFGQSNMLNVCLDHPWPWYPWFGVNAAVKRYNHKQNDALGYFMWARFPSGSGTSSWVSHYNCVKSMDRVKTSPVSPSKFLFAEVEDVHQTNPQSGPMFFLDLGISRARRPR